ncbi:MAG: TIR domain-containing protein [Candidatus Cryptobacteroides sp.]
MDKKFDVFISYSRKDYVDEHNVKIPDNPVSAIKDLLTRNNISYWFDEEGIYHGDTFAEKIASNLEKSLMVLFLASKHSNASKWTSKEIAAANAWNKKIIPVRLDNTSYNKTVILYISDLDYVEYYKDPQSAAKSILNTILTYKKEYENKLNEEKRLNDEKVNAEKRRLEQIAIKTKIERDIRIVEIGAESIDNQREHLFQMIESLDDKLLREEFELRLERTNSQFLEEKSKVELLALANDGLKKANQELQLRVDELEKSNNAQRNEDAEDERKEIVVKSRLKSQWINIIYLSVIFVLIVLSVSGFIYANRYETKYWDKCREAYSFMLKNEQFKSIIDSIGPIVLTDIQVKSEGGDYGDEILAEQSTYLYPRVKLYSTITKDIDLYVKLYQPDGSLMYNDDTSISPKGYSFKRRIEVGCDSYKYYELSGFGFEKTGNWRTGQYSYEFYYDSRCLGKKEFTIYASSRNDKSQNNKKEENTDW